MSFNLGPTRLHKHIPGLEPSVAIHSFLLLSLVAASALALATFYYFRQRSQDAQPRGCRRIGMRVPSNLTDEYDNCFHVPPKTQLKGISNPPTVPKVKSLWVYPIKSCAGIELERGTVVTTGMEYDRLFCFAQLKSPFPVSLETPISEKSRHQWEFITQRRFGSMTLIKTEVWVPDPASPTYSTEHPEVQSGGVLVIRYPSITDTGFWGTLSNLWVTIGGSASEKAVHIALNPTAEQSKENGFIMEEMKIWKDTPTCLNLGTTIAPNSKPFLEELQSLIGCTNPLALFRITPEHTREVYRCAPRKEELGWQPKVAFGDAYPLHIMNLASVRDIGTKVQGGPPQLSVRRFRPNIIFAGPEAYAEDSWKRIKIGRADYHVSCRTVRCLLPNVDPITGERHPSEPNRTLKSFRRVDEGDTKNACIGMQMVPAGEESQIKVGDVIEVLETGDHYYIRQ